MSTSLAELLAPISADDFKKNYLYQKPLHIKGDAAKWSGAAVMDWDLLTNLLNMSGIWSAKSLELVVQQKRLPPEQFCQRGLDRDQRENWLPDVTRVKQWLQQGATLTLNDIVSLTPGLRAIAETLQNDIGGKVQANLYCSWQEHPGFATHFDTHEVFVTHITGKKRWRLYGRPIENPIMHPAFKNLPREYHEKNCGPISQEIILEPGDFLYIPRGWYHDALAVTSGTVHVTFGLTPAIGLDALSRLFEMAVMNPLFREAIPNDATQRAAYLGRLADAAQKTITGPEFNKIIEHFIAAYHYPSGELRLPDDAGRKNAA